MAKNIFEGDSYQALFVRSIYRALMSREWLSYSDIMQEFLPKSKNLSDIPISKCEHYGDLRKAFIKVRNAIIKVTQDEGCIQYEGSNQNKRFRYVGNDKDPLLHFKNAVTIKDLRTYWEFCQDSAGFLPLPWLEYFFKDSQDLVDIQLKKNVGEQIIYSSIDRQLANIELLPILYLSIKQKKVLSFDYNPFGESDMSVIFHPHLLKEFNGRWYIFGHAENVEPLFGFNVAIDRIIPSTLKSIDAAYIPQPTGFYENLFKNLVGVTHLSGNQATEVYVRAKNLYMFRLMETKPLHSSQIVTKPFACYDTDNYGEFRLYVEVNNEFIGRILQMGDGLEITGPAHVRQLFIERIKKLYDSYIK